MEEHWKLASNLQREDKIFYVPIIIKKTSRKSIAVTLFMLLQNQKNKEGVSQEEKKNNSNKT